MEGLPNKGGMNIAHEAVDKHANSSTAKITAFRWIGKDGSRKDITYEQLGVGSIYGAIFS